MGHRVHLLVVRETCRIGRCGERDTFFSTFRHRPKVSHMKQITAVIKPFKLEEVREALAAQA
jgi:hypothetical protein